VRELVRSSAQVRKRESDLNAVGPKTVETGLTGQTGCPDRSDRSGPDCQEHFGLVM
jgi:hypothetical protein